MPLVVDILQDLRTKPLSTVAANADLLTETVTPQSIFIMLTYFVPTISMQRYSNTRWVACNEREWFSMVKLLGICGHRYP